MTVLDLDCVPNDHHHRVRELPCHHYVTPTSATTDTVPAPVTEYVAPTPVVTHDEPAPVLRPSAFLFTSTRLTIFAQLLLPLLELPSKLPRETLPALLPEEAR